MEGPRAVDHERRSSPVADGRRKGIKAQGCALPAAAGSARALTMAGLTAISAPLRPTAPLRFARSRIGGGMRSRGVRPRRAPRSGARVPSASCVKAIAVKAIRVKSNKEGGALFMSHPQVAGTPSLESSWRTRSCAGENNATSGRWFPKEGRPPGKGPFKFHRLRRSTQAPPQRCARAGGAGPGAREAKSQHAPAQTIAREADTHLTGSVGAAGLGTGSLLAPAALAGRARRAGRGCARGIEALLSGLASQSSGSSRLLPGLGRQRRLRAPSLTLRASPVRRLLAGDAAGSVTRPPRAGGIPPKYRGLRSGSAHLVSGSWRC